MAAPIIMQGRRGLVLPSRSTNLDAVDEKGSREATHGYALRQPGVADPKRRESARSADVARLHRRSTGPRSPISVEAHRGGLDRLAGVVLMQQGLPDEQRDHCLVEAAAGPAPDAVGF